MTNKNTAAVVLAHGLNTTPESMGQLKQLFQKHGCKVFSVVLSGHDGARDKMCQATFAVWLADFYAVHKRAAQYAKQEGVPLFACGFSLGALVALLSFQKNDCPLDKMVLFAPPLFVRFHLRLLLKLFCWLPCFPVPSLTPRSIRVFSWLPLSIYFRLVRAAKQASQLEKWQIDSPALIFCDPRDELVDVRQLSGFISQKKLTDWRLEYIKSDKQVGHHHLIISPESAGEGEWARILRLVIKFLEK